MNLFSVIFFFLITWTLKVFDNFSKFHKFSKFFNFGNFIIFQIKKLQISLILQFHFKKQKNRFVNEKMESHLLLF